MIRLERDAAASLNLLGAPEGTIAYVDADWLADDVASVPHLAVLPDRQLVWSGGHSRELPGDIDPDVAAVRALTAVARAAAQAVEYLPPESVEVVGTGIVASMVRSYAGVASGTVAARPRAIIDTTGDPDTIRESCRRVADLGVVVLAGEASGRRIELNLYPDVHVRGLSLVGAPPPLLEDFLAAAAGERDSRIEADCLAELAHASPGSPLPGGAWFRIS